MGTVSLGYDKDGNRDWLSNLLDAKAFLDISMQRGALAVKLKCHISARVYSAEDADMLPGGFPEALADTIIIKDAQRESC